MESSHPHSWSQVHCPAGLRLLIKGPRLLRSKWCDPSANAATVTAAVILAGVLDCHLLSATNQLCDCGWCFRWVSIVGVAWLTFYCFVLYWAKPWEYLVYTGDIKWGQVLWPLGSKSRNRSFTPVEFSVIDFLWHCKARLNCWRSTSCVGILSCFFSFFPFFSLALFSFFLS